VLGLSEFAVAYDIHAGFRLLPHHFGNGFLKAGGMRGVIVGATLFNFFQKSDELGRPDETADVRGQNSILIACHSFPLVRARQ